MTNDKSAFYKSIFAIKQIISHLAVHFSQSYSRRMYIVFHAGIIIAHLFIGILHIRKININDAVEQLKDFKRIITVRIIDQRDLQAHFTGNYQSAYDLWCEMRWGYEADRVAAMLLLQFEHDLGKPLNRDLIL